jgi:hypothetical protein
MKLKILPFATSILTLGIVTCLVSGCAWSIGEHKEHAQPTRGQELIDLKKARDTGAISDVEYETQKKQLLGK